MNRDLKQLIGFILFWMAVGMLFMIFIKSDFAGVVLAGVFLLTGYFLFTGFRFPRRWK